MSSTGWIGFSMVDFTYLGSLSWLIWTTSLLVYIISVNSLGKTSLTHYLLFTGLRRLLPTPESIERIRQSNSPHATKASLLQVFVTTIEPGSITLQSLKSPTNASYWKILDATMTFTLISIGFVIISSCIQQFVAPACCTVAACELEVLQREFSATVSFSSTCYVLTWLYLWHRLARESDAVEGLYVLVRPSSVLSALFCAAASWFLSRDHGLTNIPFYAGIEEFSARLILLSRLMGIQLGPIQLEFIIKSAQSLLAITTGYVGYILAESVESQQYAFIHNFSGSVQGIAYPRMHYLLSVSPAWLAGLVCGVLWSFFMTSDYLVGIRITLVFIFALSVTIPIRVWVQEYLDEAYAIASWMLEHTADNEDIEAVIRQPFSSRQTIARYAGRLVAVPALFMLLGTASVLSKPIVNSMYPLGYDQSVLDSIYDEQWLKMNANGRLDTNRYRCTNCEEPSFHRRRKGFPMPPDGSSLLDINIDVSKTILSWLKSVQDKTRDPQGDQKSHGPIVLMRAFSRQPLFTRRIIYAFVNHILLILSLNWLVAMVLRWFYIPRTNQSWHVPVVTKPKTL